MKRSTRREAARRCAAAALAWSAVCGAALAEPEQRTAEAGSKRWFVGLHASNFHPRLSETEREINWKLNTLAGSLLPRWKEPTTFKDWSDDFRVWDFHLIGGRGISPKLDWFGQIGGAMATIPTTERYYPLLLPIKLDIAFTQLEIFAGPGLVYYPWGKPADSPAVTERNLFKRMGRGARPFAALSAGYAYRYGRGDIGVSALGLGRLYRYKTDRHHHLFQANPRVGVELPITAHDALAFSGAYSVYMPRGNEYDAWSIGITYLHRFRAGKKQEDHANKEKTR